MSTMIDIVLQQTNSARPQLTFHYMPTVCCEPSHKDASVRSHRRSDEVREMSHPEKDGRSRDGNGDWSVGVEAPQDRRVNPGRPVKSATASTPYASRSQRATWFEEQMQISKPQRERPQPLTATPKLYNPWKYYEFHKQNRHTTAECRELRNTLHELADKGQIGRFLKRGL
ncbi:hypothetical protein Cgig2_015787 [Carnegiea gigantea]|uniref:Uncharacterized protein n=1 Tax=Carnegiea gigantea TaxID=171969 RepID=A0A9Q1JG56_9CARY|nr:hypothetical protein Cgig2_015787 [Carnegiea gigantea]